MLKNRLKLRRIKGERGVMDTFRGRKISKRREAHSG